MRFQWEGDIRRLAVTKDQKGISSDRLKTKHHHDDKEKVCRRKRFLKFIS